MSASVTRGHRGYGIVRKISGSGPIVATTEILIPSLRFFPRNPLNNMYPPMVNKSSYPSVAVLGKRTPSVGIQTCAKHSWFTPNWLNTLIHSVDANGDNDVLAWALNNGSSTRKYDGCRCTALGIQANAGGGPVLIDMGFLAKTASGTTTFTSSPTTDAGQPINVAQIDFGAAPGADLVRSFRINWLRGVAYDWFFNQSFDPNDTSAGMFGGVLQLEQSPLYSITPSTTVTIRLFTGLPGALVLHMTITCLLNLDEEMEDIDPGPGTLIKQYSLIDLTAGGNPATVA